MKTRSLRTLAILALAGVATGATGGTSLAAPRAEGAAAAPRQNQALEVELYCGRFLNDEVRCSTIVYGGSGSLSYSWIGAQPLYYDSSSAVAECYYGQYHYVEVLVTDGNGNSGGAWLSFQC